MKIYNKLVRDNIPKIISDNGEKPVIRILNDAEYKLELEKKLYEEYNEVIGAFGKDRLEELADLIEVISYLAKLEGASLETVINIAKEKNFKRGGFDKRIFLENVVENDS